MLIINDVNKTTAKLAMCGLNVETKYVPLDIENVNCICKGMFIMQEMCTRLWECNVHGKTGFGYVIRIVKELVESKNISFDNAWDLSNNYLRELYDRRKNGQYYNDENFDRDLKRKFMFK